MILLRIETLRMALVLHDSKLLLVRCALRLHPLSEDRMLPFVDKDSTKPTGEYLQWCVTTTHNYTQYS